MRTPAEEAVAEGFAALSEVHAKTWAFGDASFAGVRIKADPSVPRLPGSTDRLVVLQVDNLLLPAVPPARGDTISQAGKNYRVTIADRETKPGFTIFTLSA